MRQANHDDSSSICMSHLPKRTFRTLNKMEPKKRDHFLAQVLCHCSWEGQFCVPSVSSRRNYLAKTLPYANIRSLYLMVSKANSRNKTKTPKQRAGKTFSQKMVTFLGFHSVFRSLGPFERCDVLCQIPMA